MCQPVYFNPAYGNSQVVTVEVPLAGYIQYGFSQIKCPKIHGYANQINA